VTWQKELTESVKELGHTSLLAFAANSPGATYEELAERLGPKVMPVQVLDLHLREALSRGPAAYREAAADALARQLRARLPAGWSRSAADGVDHEFANISAWVTWTSALAQVERDDAVVERLWEALKRRAVPGWRPSSGTDPTIVAAFDEAWPSHD